MRFWRRSINSGSVGAERASVGVVTNTSALVDDPQGLVEVLVLSPVGVRPDLRIDAAPARDNQLPDARRPWSGTDHGAIARNSVTVVSWVSVPTGNHTSP